ncbi:hypothetical protein BpHYR1_043905 [Brachionus plicatilis]|uniref:Uncharacterized protein n=1 Tax=Brachionus plicatilis TaxID=10195 RepID=A0A3M7SST2_BRAPC|nr:hypothetical protein BpHYR1_043905 [Brachionus plicatilis]
MSRSPILRDRSKALLPNRSEVLAGSCGSFGSTNGSICWRRAKMKSQASARACGHLLRLVAEGARLSGPSLAAWDASDVELASISLSGSSADKLGARWFLGNEFVCVWVCVASL